MFQKAQSDRLLATADDSMMNHGHRMSMLQEMDTNGDGKISKDEYVAYYEKQWTKLKKYDNGRVDQESMKMVHGMMRDSVLPNDSKSH